MEFWFPLAAATPLVLVTANYYPGADPGGGGAMGAEAPPPLQINDIHGYLIMATAQDHSLAWLWNCCPP